MRVEVESCFAGKEQRESLLVLPPRHKRRQRCEMRAAPAESEPMGLLRLDQISEHTCKSKILPVNFLFIYEN